MQQSIYERALPFQKANSYHLTTSEKFKDFFAGENLGGFAYVYSSDDESIEPLLKEYKISARCIPLTIRKNKAICIFTGKPGAKKNYLRQSLLAPEHFPG